MTKYTFYIYLNRRTVIVAPSSILNIERNEIVI